MRTPFYATSAPITERHAAVIDLHSLPPSHLLDDNEAASALDTKPGTLAVWRSVGRYNLPFVKIGRRVKYKVGDLRAFIESRTKTHTGQA